MRDFPTLSKDAKKKCVQNPFRELRLKNRKAITMTTFRSDLAFGDKYQELFISSMTPQPSYLEVKKGNFAPYDFIADNLKYECKADRMAHKTGNICIEYYSRGKPSGISISEADFWIYMLVAPDGEISDTFKIPSDVLKEEIEKRSYTREVTGGDNWSNKMYLFPKSVFSNYLL
jgi:hypothetical protein